MYTRPQPVGPGIQIPDTPGTHIRGFQIVTPMTGHQILSFLKDDLRRTDDDIPILDKGLINTIRNSPAFDRTLGGVNLFLQDASSALSIIWAKDRVGADFEEERVRLLTRIPWTRARVFTRMPMPI